MARSGRLKYHDPRDGYYHVTSRTVLKTFLLDDAAKEQFQRILKYLAGVYFVKVVTFSVMSNHFHLIVQMVPESQITSRQLRERFQRYYNHGKSKNDWTECFDDRHLRRRLSDLSCFVQDLKQRFARWYNRQHKNHGHVWSERFKSVMLESGRALLACMVYVELNSLRAGIVSRPEDYRYCGLACYLTGGRAASWLDRDSLIRAIKGDRSGDGDDQVGAIAENKSSGTWPQFLMKQSKYRNDVRAYLEIVYREGMVDRPGKAKIAERTAQEAVANDFAELGIFSLRRRIRHFSDGVFIGSQAFCQRRIEEFRSHFRISKELKGHHIGSRSVSPLTGGLLDLHALRNPNNHS